MDNELRQEYRREREAAEHRALEVRRAAEKRAPRLSGIREEKRLLILSLVKPETEKAEVQRELSALSAEEDALLKGLGLTKADLEPKYRCETCRDTGYLRDNSGAYCPCYTKRLLEKRSLGDAFPEAERFEAFDETIFHDPAQQKRMQNARRAAERYANALPSGETHDMLLLGPPGQGKTFLLNCIACRAAERGVIVVKSTAYHLIDALAGAFREGREAPKDFFRAGLLCIDDLGTEPMMKNITREYIFSILNERQIAKRPTVIATNLAPGELQDRYGERVISRLFSPRESLVLRFTGPDVRLIKS